MKEEIRKARLAVEKARESVKRQRKALKTAPEDKKAIRARILKSAETKLSKAEKILTDLKQEYKDSKPKFSISDTVKNIPLKKAFTYTGLAITTVITTVAGFALYSYVSKDKEDVVATDAV